MKKRHAISQLSSHLHSLRSPDLCHGADLHVLLHGWLGPDGPAKIQHGLMIHGKGKHQEFPCLISRISTVKHWV